MLLDIIVRKDFSLLIVYYSFVFHHYRGIFKVVKKTMEKRKVLKIFLCECNVGRKAVEKTFEYQPHILPKND